MKSTCLLLCILPLFLLAACQRSKNQAAVVNTSSTDKTDTLKQVAVTRPRPIVPHTDSFYGPLIENDFNLPVSLAANDGTMFQGYIYVYAAYNAAGMVKFTSSYTNTIENSYFCGINGDFMVDSSGSYALSNQSPIQVCSNFKLFRDSLIVNSNQFFCPDNFIIYFAGKKI